MYILFEGRKLSMYKITNTQDLSSYLISKGKHQYIFNTNNTDKDAIENLTKQITSILVSSILSSHDKKLT